MNNIESSIEVVILDLRHTHAIDASAMRKLRELIERTRKKGIQVVFSHVNEQPRKVMEKDGFIDYVGAENFRENIMDAISFAESKL